MQKVLGQDIKNLDERKQFLIDNADEVVEMDYSKAFDADEHLQRRRLHLQRSLSKFMTCKKKLKTSKQKRTLN